MKIANPRHKYFLLLIFKLILLSISIYHPSISPNGASVPSVDASNNIDDDSDHTPTSMLLLLPLRLLLLPPPLLLLLLQLLPSLLCSHLSHFRGLLLLQQSILKQTTSLFQPLAGHYFLHIQSPMGRRFSKNWYKLYPWLEYEITKDAAFLFHLYSLFKQCPPAGKMDSQLRGGFNTWKKATIAFSKHALSQLNHAPNTRLEFR